MFELIGTMIFLVCGVDVLRKWLFADNAKDWNKYLFHLFLLVIIFFVWSYGFGSLDREYERERTRTKRRLARIV